MGEQDCKLVLPLLSERTCVGEQINRRRRPSRNGHCLRNRRVGDRRRKIGLTVGRHFLGGHPWDITGPRRACSNFSPNPSMSNLCTAGTPVTLYSSDQSVGPCGPRLSTGCTQFFTCHCEIGPACRTNADTVFESSICDGPRCTRQEAVSDAHQKEISQTPRLICAGASACPCVGGKSYSLPHRGESRTSKDGCEEGAALVTQGRRVEG